MNEMKYFSIIFFLEFLFKFFGLDMGVFGVVFRVKMENVGVDRDVSV